MIPSTPESMRYQVSVPAHWMPGVQTRTATVYDMKTQNVAARGVAKVAKTGEPITVDIPGFKVDTDWDLLGTGQGPGEWVCTARKIKEGEG